MKTFMKENWYKLMVGSSMMMVSFGFMMYAISPAYSSNNANKVEIPVKFSEEQKKENNKSTGNSTYSDFVVVGGKVYGLRNGNSGYYKSDWDNCW
jgi:hypothetical protein